MSSPKPSVLNRMLDFDETPEKVQLDLKSTELPSPKIDYHDDSSRDSGISVGDEHSTTYGPTNFSGLLLKSRDPFTELSVGCSRNLIKQVSENCSLDVSDHDILQHEGNARRPGLKRKQTDSSADLINGKKVRLHAEGTAKEAGEARENAQELVGDCSRNHRLPTTKGPQQNLQYITPATMVDLITGRVSLDENTDYKIIDCRYPYEYGGGHIPGALNLHTEDSLTIFLKNAHKTCKKDSILIFHCEFSLERGPKSAKTLRSLDRQFNAEKYPLLNFPEIYVMKGGYKDFFDQHEDQCEPRFYVPMLHENHRSDLKLFRRKSKSWSAGDKPSSLRQRSRVSRVRLEY